MHNISSPMFTSLKKKYHFTLATKTFHWQRMLATMICWNSFFLSLSDTFLKYLYHQMIQRYMILKDAGFFFHGYTSVTQQRSALLWFTCDMLVCLIISIYLASLTVLFQISLCLSFSKYLVYIRAMTFWIINTGTMLPRNETIWILNYPVCLQVYFHTTLASEKQGRWDN